MPGRRTTLEVLPSVWFFSDNDDYVGQTLSTDPMFQLEAHLTRDFTEHFWGSLDSTYMAGGKSTVNGVGGDSLNNVGVGFTLGYQINDNLSLTAGYMATVNDSDPGDLQIGRLSPLASPTAGTRSSKDRSASKAPNDQHIQHATRRMNRNMNTTRITRLTAAILVGTLACASPLIGQDAPTDDQAAKAAALAKATLNPIASLISVPLQNNFDWGAGPDDDGFQYRLTVQPVIPISLNTETSYDWEREQWTVPINAFAQQLLKVGQQPIALQLGGRYYADGPSGAPEWGLRFQLSLLFPK